MSHTPFVAALALLLGSAAAACGSDTPDPTRRRPRLRPRPRRCTWSAPARAGRPWSCSRGSTPRVTPSPRWPRTWPVPGRPAGTTAPAPGRAPPCPTTHRIHRPARPRRSCTTRCRPRGSRRRIVVLGWSYGGLVAQAFAATYPDDIAGLVLQDTAVRAQFTDPTLRENDEGQGVVWSEGGRDVDTEALLTELADLDFGDLPVAVLSQDATGPWAQAWYAAHDGLARMSSDSVHVVGVGSGHVMHEDVPALVSATVAAMVTALRDGTRLSPCDARFTKPGRQLPGLLRAWVRPPCSRPRAPTARTRPGWHSRRAGPGPSGRPGPARPRRRRPPRRRR